jgi:hypothetical protein
MNVTFSDEHDNPKDCQLILALTGSKHAIRDKLREILWEFDSAYGKPCQGRISGFNYYSDIITPVWNGGKY